MPKYAPLFDINSFMGVSAIHIQTEKAGEALARSLANDPGRNEAGYAFTVCEAWQKRFELALSAEIPADRTGLAGFRCVPDYVIQYQDPLVVFPPKQSGSHPAGQSPLYDGDDAWQVIDRFISRKEPWKKVPKQRVAVGSPLEQHMMNHLDACEPVLGGQAGNIAWLWHLLGTDPMVLVPYLAQDVVKVARSLPEMNRLRLGQFVDNCFQVNPLESALIGVQRKPSSTSPARHPAPSGASVVLLDRADRLIFALDGFRDFTIHENAQMPFHQVAISSNGRQHTNLKSLDEHDLTWPQVGLFCECWIEDSSQTLMISLVEGSALKNAVEGKVNFAVIGNMDAIFYDQWLKSPGMREFLEAIACGQLAALKEAGIQVGVELGQIPTLGYLEFLRELCTQDIVSAVGINGEDDLPLLVESEALNIAQRLFDPHCIPVEIGEANGFSAHSEYLTYLRAQGLAKWLGVQQLYVHTNSVDLVIQHGDDAQRLYAAQQGIMIGKGWVIGALAKRCWPRDPLLHIDRFYPAVKPEAMEKLAGFTRDFVRYQKLSEKNEIELLETGVWLAGDPAGYSMAAVPVLWPSGPELPPDLNTTGAGDMSFGAFMLFGMM